MLNREEAVVFVALVEDYREKLKQVMTDEDIDILVSMSKQVQNRLALNQKLTF